MRLYGVYFTNENKYPEAPGNSVTLITDSPSEVGTYFKKDVGEITSWPEVESPGQRKRIMKNRVCLILLKYSFSNIGKLNSKGFTMPLLACALLPDTFWAAGLRYVSKAFGWEAGTELKPLCKAIEQIRVFPC